MVAITQTSPSTRYKQAKPAPETCSLRDACGRLGVSYTTGQELALAGRFPVRTLRIGRQYRIQTAELDRLLGVEPDAA